eukprot:s10_g6.t2
MLQGQHEQGTSSLNDTGECVGKYPSRERWVDPVQSRRKVGSHGGCDPLLDLYAGPAGLVPRQTEGRPDGLRLGGLN